jgi:hypothetical protein
MIDILEHCVALVALASFADWKLSGVVDCRWRNGSFPLYISEFCDITGLWLYYLFK